jgi:poly-gamma-glutamate synthesis protein (capsule biosynthesis protein)
VLGISALVSPLQPVCSAQLPTVTIAAVGDVLLDRGVAQQIEEHGVDYPFARSKSLLSRADFAFGNLECPITQNGIKVTKPFCFKAHPRTTRALRDGGLDMLSLANNHTLDCNRTGLLETLQNLQAQKLRWCGAGSDLQRAETPTITTIKGIRIAWLAFGEFVPEGVFLRDDKPTIALASPESIRRAVTSANRQADIVVASFHWGVEYATRPRQQQLDWAKLAVDYGADLILGHHPHVLQGLQLQTRRVRGQKNLKRSLVAYSLGNFVFDSPRYWDKRTAQSLILRCTFNRHGIVNADVVPMTIERCQPRPATGTAAQTILRQLQELSGELGTRLSGRQIRF